MPSPDDIQLLVSVLPGPLEAALGEHPSAQLVEIVLDLGREPEARLHSGTVPLSGERVDRAVLEHIVERVGEFGSDNRAGIERTLHRISAIRNRRGEVVGLTLRVGRAVFGTIDMLRDLVESGKNILLLGAPGIGKTTKLREVARVLADDLGKRVMVIDTSNEIAGDGDVPHPGIGHARRMQVPRADQQHDVMIEAVENHMPEAIVVDEIGTRHEAEAARTIVERGVQLIGTAHGNTLENLILNPTLSDLVGGVETVTLSDEEARRRGTMKTISERRAPPTFDIVVELVGRDEVIVHADTARAVDKLLSGRFTGGERRSMEGDRVVTAPMASLRQQRDERRDDAHERPPPFAPPPRADRGPLRIFAPGVPRDVIRKVAEDLGSGARATDRVDTADIVLMLKARGGNSRMRRLAETRGLPVFNVKRASTSAVRKALRHALPGSTGHPGDPGIRDAVEEAEHAIRRVLADGIPVSLAPRSARIRSLQHELVSRYHLGSKSSGREPARHLVVTPEGTEE